MNLRLNALLLLALVATGLALVRSAYDTRRLFAEIERAREQEQRLAGEAKRLEAAARGASTYLLVEKEARTRLLMRPTSPAVTLEVNDPLSAAAAPTIARAPAAPASGAQR